MKEPQHNCCPASAYIVRALWRNDRSLKQIGALMGVGESFICRVRKGQRDLTLKHLVRLEKSLGEPAVQLFIEAMRKAK